MKTSDTIGKLVAALVAARAEFPPIHFDSVNPHFRNKYASLSGILDAVTPVLTKHGLAVMQGATVPETVEGVLTGFAVESILLHTSGEWMSTTVIVPVEKPSAQGAGGALTYGRRYGVSALLNIAPDADDDGEMASNHPQTARPAAQSAPAPRTPPKTASAPPRAAKPSGVPSCPKCGGAMWDNRENKQNPKSPDFKCKDKNCKDEKGFGTALWVKDMQSDMPAEREPSNDWDERPNIEPDEASDLPF